ncbi:MAG: nucleotidyltransferase family protein [Woeseiaceae bacterium]
MILAAGRGERLRPLTDSVPKALTEVHGQSLLERHLQSLKEAGVETVVINLGWLGEQIADRVGSGAAYGLNVVYSPEDEEILETGGGIHHALPLLGTDPFIVVNADIFTDMPMPAFELNAQDMGSLMLIPTPDDKAKGDFDAVDGRLRNGPERPYTFSGVAVYRPEFFADCTPGRFSIVSMLRAAADADQLAADVYSGSWTDVGTVERLESLNRQ